MGTGGTGRALLTLSLSSTTRFSSSILHPPKLFSLPKLLFRPLTRPRVYLRFRPLCSTVTAPVLAEEESIQPLKHSILLEKLRTRHLKDTTKTPTTPKTKPPQKLSVGVGNESQRKNNKRIVESFEELGLSEEVMGAVKEMGISVPTEIQCIGIPAVLGKKSVVLGSHTGSGKTLAYMLPLVQLMREDEGLDGILMKPRRPRAVVLCPTRELSEQVFRVSKSVSHHARFRSTMVSGGGRLKTQEDTLNGPIDMVVGTPGRVLQHIEEGNMVYGDIKYLVLDEADTMFDRGFGPDIRKFLGPLKSRASRPNGKEFQTILVSATMTKAVQKLVDEEFQGIVHLRTSTLHKKIASSRHDFIKLSGSENKLEALLQVLEPSLAKGNRVMVFCNTLNSSRAVDHFLNENQIATVNYHGEVPAEERVENLTKFKSDDGDCPTLVCTDLAARGLDLDVDHVIMFDFPSNSIDYLHRTGRTARMGAKGKVTGLVAKKDVVLADRIEEAIRKNESLEALSIDSVKRDIARSRITEQKGKSATLVKVSNHRNKTKAMPVKSSSRRPDAVHAKKISSKVSAVSKSTKTSKAVKSLGIRGSKGVTSGGKRHAENPRTSKLNVVGFRGRTSSSKSSFKVA